MDTLELIKKYLGDIDVKFSEEQAASKFLLLLNELKGWNEKFNLTSITDDKEIIIKHFADSLVLVKPNKSMLWQTIVDIGAGAGFPSLPLAIAFPDKKIYVNESNNKKLLFLKEIIKTLGLTNAVLLPGRSEDLSYRGKYREFFDVAAARALAKFPIALELCAGFVKPGGYVFYYASSKQAAEITPGLKVFKELGCSLEGIYGYELPEGSGSHAIVSVKKLWKTPAKYPRQFGAIKKKPL